MAYWIYLEKISIAIPEIGDTDTVLGMTPIARITGTEAAYEVYHKACELVELTGGNCMLVAEENGEVIAEYKENK